MRSQFPGGLDFTDDLELGSFLEASDNGALKSAKQTGRRTRKRQKRSHLAEASLLAPLLMADAATSSAFARKNKRKRRRAREEEAQTTTTQNSSEDNDDVSPVLVTKAARDTGITAEEDQSIRIPLSTLFANDTTGNVDALKLVRVFRSRRGSVEVDGDAIIFTPEPGFTGRASFRYMIEDENGVRSKATVVMRVVEAAPAPADENAGSAADAAPADEPNATDVEPRRKCGRTRSHCAG